MAIIPITKREVALLLAPHRAYYTKVSFDVGEGHTQDFAYYDRETGIMHVNGPLLPQAPVWAGYFYLYRALAYAQMCKETYRFPLDVQDSLPYAILGNGRCAKWVDNKWVYCRLDGDVDYWDRAITNMPYELEAVEYAVGEAYDLLSYDLDRDNLHMLAQMHAPRKPFEKSQYAALFSRIDATIDGRG